MIDAALTLIAVTSKTDLLPPRGRNIYNAGIKEGDKGHERYAHPSSVHPNLLLINPISDDNGNMIMPGYYELVLSEDRTMLVLVQAGVQIASFPVFKTTEERSKEQIAQPMDKKSLRKFNKEQKKKAKETKKAIKQGKMPEEPQEYNNATIEYDDDGEYYLIKYERGNIRAWGAIKQ